MPKFKYDAFISYRHVEPDAYVASQVHKQLESFKLPKSVKKRVLSEKIDGRTEITRVFRDQEELPLASNLADPIVDALENSDYLIVICSPRLKESIWCQKEIDTFISLRGKDHILAVLAEGEPDESFPKELLTREKTVEVNGVTTVIQEQVEPLAADARGTSDKERKKKLKNEILRLAAPMFEVSFDDLKQRHKEQRMKRILGISFISSLVFLAFGVVSTFLALKINNQNIEIQKQSDEIEAQAVKIEEQYNESLINHAKSMAGSSKMLLEKGDRIAAIKTAYSVFPSKDNPDLPYEASVELALSNALHAYDMGVNYTAEKIIKTSTNINYACISPDSSKIMTYDISKQIAVWDIETGERLWNKFLKHSLIDEDTMVFTGNSKVMFEYDGKVLLYDIENDKQLMEIDVFGCNNIEYSSLLDKAVIYDTEKIRLIDVADCKVEYEIPYDDLGSFGVKGSPIDSSGKYISAAYGEDTQYVSLFDLSTGAKLWTNQVTAELLGFLQVEDNGVYLSANYDNEDAVFGTDLTSVLYSYDLSGNLRWTYENTSNWFDKMVMARNGNHGIAAFASDMVYLLDESGNLNNVSSIGSSVVNIMPTTNDDVVMAFTRGGDWVNIAVDKNLMIASTYFNGCTSTNIRYFMAGMTADEAFLATIPYSSNEITLYKAQTSDLIQPLCAGNGSVRNKSISEDGTLASIVWYPGQSGQSAVTVYDLDTYKEIFSWGNAEDNVDFTFFDGDLLYIFTLREIITADMKTGDVVNEIPTESFVTDGRADTVNKLIIGGENERCFVKYETGEEIAKIMDTCGDVNHKNTIVPGKDTDGENLALYKVDLSSDRGDIEVKDLEKLQVLEDREAFAHSVFFDESDSYMFVSFCDGTYKVYKTKEDGTVDETIEPTTFESLGGIPTGIEYDPNTGYGLLATTGLNYIVTAADGQLNNLEYVGQVDSAVLNKAKLELLTHDRKNIFVTKIATCEQIAKMAEKQIESNN